MIILEKVDKYFNRHKKNQIHVINNTSLKFGDNGLVALLGASGSGKTTLLNAIGGLDKVSKGKIYINNQRITKKSSSKIDNIRNLNIGYIFQDYHLIDNMSVYDNVALVLRMTNIKNKAEIKKRVDYVLERVGMYRYRNRMAGMLSGGERQRVGIARAIVKNPSIIIADEPTGNLDSKNTLEIMNIIKSISNEKLVILVTHEKDLANFYASRVINLKDGEIVSDEENDNEGELDYRIDNKIYLKDITNKTELKKGNISVNIYNETKDNVSIDIVIKNGNIYLKTENNEKLELVDDSSNIEFIDDHYKKLSKSEYEDYKFDFDKIINKDIKQKYTSIYNPITLIINGFKKVINYPFLKKMLLLGFLVSGAFILYSISNIYGILDVQDEKFVTKNQNYLNLVLNKVKVADYISYESLPDVNYIMPGDSSVTFSIKYEDYYQTSKTTDSMTGSLSGLSMITEKDLIYGRMPENNYEIVVDKMTVNNLFNNQLAKQAGVIKIKDMLGRVVTIDKMDDFTIVGITDLKSPSIYTNESMFINIIYNSGQSNVVYREYKEISVDDGGYDTGEKVLDYTLVSNEIKLVKGRWPSNDYEVVIDESNSFTYKIGKYLDMKVNGNKLKVVGYYHDKEARIMYLTNLNTVKYDLITKTANITVYPKDKTTSIDYFRSVDINVEDIYAKERETYMNSIKDSIVITLVIAGVILLISLVEIFLMVRSSFLSRVKEVGILRAIGLKKKDVYKMFLGEIIAITTLSSVPGYLLMIYILNTLVTLPLMKDQFTLNGTVLLVSIILIYVFNVVVGLLPVFNTLKKTPAAILSRTDI